MSKFNAYAADGSLIGIDFHDMTSARKAIEGREGACVRKAGDIVALLPAQTSPAYLESVACDWKVSKMSPSPRTDMLPRLDSYDWEEAFGFADGVTRQDVADIIGADEGCNDGPDWVALFLLNDGRFMFLKAWCDYTGWDCQAGGAATFFATRSEAVQAMDDTDRDRCGLGAEYYAAVKP